MSNQKIEESAGENTPSEKSSEKRDDRPVCGLIMPIADTEGYPPNHWKEVKNILTSVAEEAGFRTRLVSESDDVRIIQTTIVQNVFDDDIIICDVSSKNPNVMFELGLRLAFDKAAVIVKDNVTGYSFDTSPVEHINYPKDLRYYDIEEFRTELKAKLNATYNESLKPNHSMYLSSFGKFVVKSLQTEEVSNDEYVLEALKEIRLELKNLKSFELIESPPITINRRDGYYDNKSLIFMKESFKEFVNNPNINEKDNFSEFIKFLNLKSHQNNIKVPSLSTVQKFFNSNFG